MRRITMVLVLGALALSVTTATTPVRALPRVYAMCAVSPPMKEGTAPYTFSKKCNLIVPVGTRTTYAALTVGTADSFTYECLDSVLGICGYLPSGAMSEDKLVKVTVELRRNTAVLASCKRTLANQTACIKAQTITVSSGETLTCVVTGTTQSTAVKISGACAI
jgi:hypothetical protein